MKTSSTILSQDIDMMSRLWESVASNVAGFGTALVAGFVSQPAELHMNLSPQLHSAALSGMQEPDSIAVEPSWRFLPYQPQTPLGRKFMELRAKRAARGEKFIVIDELDIQLTGDDFLQEKSLDRLAIEQGFTSAQRIEDMIGHAASLWDNDEDFEAFLASPDGRG